MGCGFSRWKGYDTEEGDRVGACGLASVSRDREECKNKSWKGGFLQLEEGWEGWEGLEDLEGWEVALERELKGIEQVP